MSKLGGTRQAFSRINPRVRGMILLLLGLFASAVFILGPITMARAGKSFTWFPVVALLAVSCVLCGLFLLVFGHRGAEWLSSAPGAGMDYSNLSVPQVIAIIGMAAPALLIVFLFNSYLTHLATP